jgi:hypothetical protein
MCTARISVGRLPDRPALGQWRGRVLLVPLRGPGWRAAGHGRGRCEAAAVHYVIMTCPPIICIMHTTTQSPSLGGGLGPGRSLPWMRPPKPRRCVQSSSRGCLLPKAPLYPVPLCPVVKSWVSVAAPLYPVPLCPVVKSWVSVAAPLYPVPLCTVGGVSAHPRWQFSINTAVWTIRHSADPGH